MTNWQKIKRVLFSPYGVLTVLTQLLVLYALSFFEFPTKGGQQSRDNPLYIVIYFSVLLFPFGIFFWGWEKFEDKDRQRRLEDNPHIKRELKESESLIDFLYENEHEEEM